MRKKIIIILLVVFALILTRMLFSHINKTNTSKNKAAGVPSVTVEEVQTREITREYSANARVTAKYRVDVLARISGYLIKSYFKEGDYVKAGQVLFEIEPQEYKYALERAKANMDNVKSQSDYYQKQLVRYKELVQSDYIAKSDYDSMLSQSNSYSAQLESAKNAYLDAKRNMEYTKVKSPVDGRVGIIDVTVGNYVSMNSGALTTINSSNPMYITFPLDAKEYTELVQIDGASAKRNVEFIFSSGNKYSHNGIQDFYDNKVDTSTGTITLRATFPNPDDELIHGDFGRVIIYSNKKTATPIVPQNAAQENQEGRYVYILDENNLPKMVYIKTIGQTEDGYWIISDGVKAGDRIITTGLLRVVTGRPVKIVEKVDKTQDAPQKKQGIISKVFNKLTKKDK